MEDVPASSVVGLDISRRALSDARQWLSADLSALETLDASRNEMSSLRGFEALLSLRALNLYFNRIAGLGELLRLRGAARTMRSIDLRLNPVAREEGYRRCVRRSAGPAPSGADRRVRR